MKLNLFSFFLFCSLCTGFFTSPRAAFSEEPSEATYIIPVEGVIEKALLYVIRRGMRQAEERQAGAIILVMDTPGGELGAADEIVRLLLNTKIPTYTFVKGHAFSAGAIIAIATDSIYMAPGSVIGAATPIMMSPFGGAQEMPDAIEEKTISAVSALIRSAAQNKGHDPQLAEAMVRREKEFMIGDKVVSPAGELLTLTNTEAEELVGEDQTPLLSAGTINDIDELIVLLGRNAEKVITLEVTSVERAARVIASFSAILLAAGLLGIYIEVRTPGFGVPGIIGVMCLLIFFWGHHIAGLAGMEDMFIFMLGVALVLVEIFFIPGFGVVGVFGFILILVGLFSAMLPQLPDVPLFAPRSVDAQHAFNVIAGALVMTGLVVLLVFPRTQNTRLFRWIVLDKSTSKEAGYTVTESKDELLGMKGLAVTILRPSGTGEFEDHRLNVVTRGEFLDAGTALRVVEVRGGRVVVEQDQA